MSNTMSLAPTGLLAVDCVTCSRRVRVSDAADYPLSRAMADLGWVLSEQGKWQCDECKEPAEPGECREPGWIRCPQGCGIVIEECELCVTCAVCPRCCSCGQFVPRSDATVAAAGCDPYPEHLLTSQRARDESQAKAYDLETVGRFAALGLSLLAQGRMSGMSAERIAQAVREVNAAVAFPIAEEL